tara:strand:- start:1435 stop:1710 length:276 start_codon:yes stop_codon:yes gene_type:complete
VDFRPIASIRWRVIATTKAFRIYSLEVFMNHEQEQRAMSLLLGGISEDVVYDMLAMEADAHGTPLDEFAREDLPIYIRQLNERIRSQGEIT